MKCLLCISIDLLQYSFLGKVISKLSCCNRFGSVRSQIAESATAFPYRNAALLQQLLKLFKAFGRKQCGTDISSKDILIRFKLSAPRRKSVCNNLLIEFIQFTLASSPCMIFPLGNSVLTSV